MTSSLHRERADALARPGVAIAGGGGGGGGGEADTLPGPSVADAGGAADPRPLLERARDVLEVPGPPAVRTAVRGLGALAALSVVAALPWGVVGLALLALVLLGVTLARVVHLPGGLQLLVGSTLLVAAWAALLQLYQRWSWLDIAVHGVATGLLTVLAVALLARTRLLPVADRSLVVAPSSALALARTPATARPNGPTLAAGRPERVRRGAVIVAMGLALAVVWELGEWAGHLYLDPAIYVSGTDTVGDVAAGVLGAAVAAWWLATRRAVGWLATRRAAP